MTKVLSIILCVCLLFIAVPDISAQTAPSKATATQFVPVPEFHPQLSLGGRVGASGSFMLFNPSVSQGLLIGPNAGFVMRYISEKYFGFQVELNYVQKGWTERNSNYSRRLNYIELPFMSHLNFGKRMFKWFFNLGPEISYLISEDRSIKNVPYDRETPEQSLNIKSYFDYGICVGTGFEFDTKAGIYQLEFRYGFGLGNIFSNAASSDFRSSSNQNLSLCFGYLFPIKK